MRTLVEVLPDHARDLGAVTAVRDRSGPTWRFLSWSELYGEVNRVAGALVGLPRGERFEWAAPPGTRRLAVDLALLHLGVVGAQLPEGGSVEDYEALLSTREETGRLVRLLSELRPRDPAAVRGGRTLDHAAVIATATRVADLVKLSSPELLLVSAGAEAEQAAGWGAVLRGYGLVVGGAELLPSAHPTAWLCTSAQLAGLGLARSRAGGFGGVLRGLGRAGEKVGERLARVYVDGPVPPEADTLRERGIEVAPWVA